MPRLIEYSEARLQIREMDLLLFRKRGPVARAGRGVHSHAARAAWWHEDLFCIEVLPWHGGRAVTLSSQVERDPGCYDVYEVNPHNAWPRYNRVLAARFMRRLAGRHYGYLGLLLTSLTHMPIVRWFYRPSADDGLQVNRPPFCSHACALADHLAGGVDPVPQLADSQVEPADLARSPFYRYRFTLIPDGWQPPPWWRVWMRRALRWLTITCLLTWLWYLLCIL